MKTNTLRRAALALTWACTAGFSMASGTDGAAGAETGDTAAYNRGKAVFATKVACPSCPMPGKSLDAALARELTAKKPPALNADEARALDVYLKRRFKL
jgi:hypothetical protein